VTGDEKMQLEGRARQAEGTLQDVYGQAKETAVDAAGAIRDRASEASDFLREMIEERPFTAAEFQFRSPPRARARASWGLSGRRGNEAS
jgi:hypothetical protein